MIAVLGINPFELAEYILSDNSRNGLGTILTLASVLAFICVIWQITQLMLHSSDEKVVEQKKKNIRKILIAYAVIISICALIQITATFYLKLNKAYSVNGGGNVHSNSWIHNHTYIEQAQ